MPTRISATVDPTRGATTATTDGGERVVMAADPPHGDGSAAGPKETLLAALAGCTAVDVVSILRKKQQSLAAYEIHVEAESASDHPRVFTLIVVEHRVSGAVTAEALRRSIELSATRYCPVSAMLSGTVRIEHRYRLTTADGSSAEGLAAVTGPEGARVA